MLKHNLINTTQGAAKRILNMLDKPELSDNVTLNNIF